MGCEGHFELTSKLQECQPHTFLCTSIVPHCSIVHHTPAINRFSKANTLIHTMAQPRSQLPLFLGLTAAGGVGYYLYSAGGSPKAAEKQFEGMSSHPTTTFLRNYELHQLSHMT